MDKRFFLAEMERLAIALPRFAPAMDNRETLAVWYAELQGISPEAFAEACGVARRTLDAFPSISWLLRTVDNTNLDAAGIGEDTAERIEAAMPMFGYTNPVAAERYIGELGWSIVQEHGGWTSICALTYDQMASMRRLWRDAARNRYIKLSASGQNRGMAIPSKAIALPPPPSSPVLQLVPEPQPRTDGASFRSALAKFRDEVGA